MPLKWTCVVARYGFSSADECHGPVWEKLVYVQSVLLSAVLSGGDKGVQNSAKRWFHNVLKNVSEYSIRGP